MLAPWEESYDKPGSILKIRSNTLPTKVIIVKTMVLPVVMDGCERCTIKRRCTKTLMLLNCDAGKYSWESPWTAKRSNQSIPKEMNPEYSLKGLMLKLQYFGHLMWRANSLEKTLTLRKIKGKRRGAAEDEMVRYHHWLNGHEF